MKNKDTLYVDNPKITHLSLCSGYGGLDLGISRVVRGLRTIAYAEIEEFAVGLLAARMESGHLDTAPIWSNLKTFPWSDFHHLVDLISGGFPCQPFSSAGNRSGDEDPRHLFPHILRGITECQPGLVFLENVEGIISAKLKGDGWRDPAGTPVLLHVLRELERVGYRATAGVFSSREIGASHQRKRVFILAMANAESGHAGKQAEREGRQDIGSRGQEAVAHGSHHGSQPQRELPQLRYEEGRQEQVRLSTSTCHARATRPKSPGSDQWWWEPSRILLKAVGDAKGVLSDVSDDNARISVEQGSLPESGDPSGADSMGNAEISNGRQQDGHGQVQAGGADVGGSLIESGLGLFPHGVADRVGSPVVYESQTFRAYQTLLSLWDRNATQEIQWSSGGPSDVLAETVLQSRLQFSAFSQRVRFVVWAVQAGHSAKGFGLPSLWLREESRDTSRGQEPRKQLARELAYALCVLSYKIALERGEEAVEGTCSVQSVRESGAAKRVLSETPPAIQEVWRSQFDEETWTLRAYNEATDHGFSRTDELRLLGNGVDPDVAAKAFVTLYGRLMGGMPTVVGA